MKIAKLVLASSLLMLLTTSAFAERYETAKIVVSNDFTVVSNCTMGAATLGGETISNWPNWKAFEPSDIMETKNRTITVSNTMTTAEIQSAIDGIKRNLGGRDISFVFNNGTYTLSQRLVFSGFYNGILLVYGEDGVTSSKSTSQNCYIDSSAVTNIQFYFFHCDAKIYFSNIKLKYTANNSYYGVKATGCKELCVYGCYFTTTTTTGNAVGSDGNSYLSIYGNYFTYGNSAVRSGGGSHVWIYTSTSTGSLPSYAVVAMHGARIHVTGTGPTGSTANNSAYGGGLIVTDAGKILP